MWLSAYRMPPMQNVPSSSSDSQADRQLDGAVPKYGDQALAQSAQIRPLRSKVMAGLLAFYGGWFGAHWFYLGRKYPWVLGVLAVILLFLASRAEVWWDTPALFVLFVPAIAGFIEAIVLCLTSDAKFDARYNPGFVRDKPTGWGPVLVASFGLLIGTVLTMFAIAHVVLHIWSRLGWLDGLNF